MQRQDETKEKINRRDIESQKQTEQYLGRFVCQYFVSRNAVCDPLFTKMINNKDDETNIDVTRVSHFERALRRILSDFVNSYIFLKKYVQSDELPFADSDLLVFEKIFGKSTDSLTQKDAKVDDSIIQQLRKGILEDGVASGSKQDSDSIRLLKLCLQTRDTVQSFLETNESFKATYVKDSLGNAISDKIASGSTKISDAMPGGESSAEGVPKGVTGGAIENIARKPKNEIIAEKKVRKFKSAVGIVLDASQKYLHGEAVNPVENNKIAALKADLIAGYLLFADKLKKEKGIEFDFDIASCIDIKGEKINSIDAFVRNGKLVSVFAVIDRFIADTDFSKMKDIEILSFAKLLSSISGKPIDQVVKGMVLPETRSKRGSVAGPAPTSDTGQDIKKEFLSILDAKYGCSSSAEDLSRYMQLISKAWKLFLGDLNKKQGKKYDVNLIDNIISHFDELTNDQKDRLLVKLSTVCLFINACTRDDLSTIEMSSINITILDRYASFLERFRAAKLGDETMSVPSSQLSTSPGDSVTVSADSSVAVKVSTETTSDDKLPSRRRSSAGMAEHQSESDLEERETQRKGGRTSVIISTLSSGAAGLFSRVKGKGAAAAPAPKGEESPAAPAPKGEESPAAPAPKGEEKTRGSRFSWRK
ncbi:MAG TPA: hypothetical protein VNC84_07270 [Gammaproteobacteria bacterium]|nr:hypothetical protein [Gammaproteobacteria bacterium]